jgi:hypothetical protein
MQIILDLFLSSHRWMPHPSDSSSCSMPLGHALFFVLAINYCGSNVDRLYLNIKTGDVHSVDLAPDFLR